MKKHTPLDLIQRPGFRIKTVDISSKKIAPLPKFNRVSNIDRDIVRRGFRVAEVKARSIPEPAIQPIDLDDTGKLVTLSDKTVDQLLSITVGDPTDVKWLQEKERLELLFESQGLSPNEIRRELEVNRPLHREQRTITRKKGVDPDPTLPLSRKLDALMNVVLDGRAESEREQAQIAGLMANAMKSITGMEQLTQLEFQKIGQTIERINPPDDPTSFNLTARFYDKDSYDAHAGNINFYLMSRIRKDPRFNPDDRSQNTLNYNHFIKDFSIDESGFPTLGIRSFIRKLQNPARQRRFIDLKRGGLVDLSQMRKIVKDNGEKMKNNPSVLVSELHQSGQ
jgi:hypothetical protein